MEYILACKCDICKKITRIYDNANSASEVAEKWSTVLNYEVVDYKGIYICDACYDALEIIRKKQDAELITFLKGRPHVDNIKS